MRRLKDLLPSEQVKSALTAKAAKQRNESSKRLGLLSTSEQIKQGDWILKAAAELLEQSKHSNLNLNDYMFAQGMLAV